MGEGGVSDTAVITTIWIDVYVVGRSEIDVTTLRTSQIKVQGSANTKTGPECLTPLTVLNSPNDE